MGRMDKTSFWSLIEEAKREGDDDCDLMADLLVSRLVLLPAEEILQFREIQNDYLAIIHRLGEVYSLLTGLPMSDDASDYFCMWIIKQGRAICEVAWDDPGVLADAPLDEASYPGLWDRFRHP